MKSQKTSLLLVVLGLLIATSSLMVVSATTELNIKSDLANAVQHIEKIIFRENMESEVGKEVNFTSKKSFARINTTGYNVVINNDSSNKNKINENRTEGNTILGGEGNTITAHSKHSVIIAGKNNKIAGSSGAVIGGGINNEIKEGSHRSVIAGGSGNTVKGRFSSIPGGENNYISGEYSVAMGVNNVVSGNISVALGSGSKVDANNSFLWTDGDHNDVLETDNTFAVVSNRGMVVNRNLPHSFAKLTIGGSGSLVIHEGEGDEVVCGTNTKGVIKAVNKDGGGVCLCSCNGTGWTSLYGGSVCGNVCGLGSSDLECGSIKKICTPGHYTYSGSCNEGKVVEGYGAYFVDKDNKVHRSCQSEDGTVIDCSGEPAPENECDHSNVKELCDFSMIDTVHNISGVTFNYDLNDGFIHEGQLFTMENIYQARSTACSKVCLSGYAVGLDEYGRKTCEARKCQGEYFGYYFTEETESGFDGTATKSGTTANGSYSCTGTALCRLGEFVEPLYETCSYMCNSGRYTGYNLEHDFAGGTYQTGSKSYVGSNGLKYDCNAKFICNNGVVEMTDEECGTDGWCPATTYTGDKIGVVNIEARPNGGEGHVVRGFSGLNGSCVLRYKCNNGVWDSFVEDCSFNCMPLNKPGGGVYGSSVFDNPNYTPTTWTYANKSNLRACEYKCDNHYTWNGSECEGPKCTGSIPDNAEINNSYAPSVNTEYHYSVNDNEPCSYKCKDRYRWNGSQCVEECTGSYPTCPGVIIGSSNGSTGWHYVDKNNNLAACEWTCDSAYYDYDESNNDKPCKPKPTTTRCSEVAYYCEDDEGMYEGTNITCSESDHKCTWECDENICPAVCADGYILNDSGECDEEEVIKICRDVIIDKTSNVSRLDFGFKYAPFENFNTVRVNCIYGGTLAGFSFRFVGNTGYNMEFQQLEYGFSQSLSSYGGGPLTQGSYCRSNRVFEYGDGLFSPITQYGINDEKISLSYAESTNGSYWLGAHSILLPDPVINVEGVDDYDFKDTCKYTYKDKYGVETTYQCSGILPEGARLNDNSLVPLYNEEYVCDVFGTGACAYHCKQGWVCNEDGTGCERSDIRNGCSRTVFMCNDGEYGEVVHKSDTRGYVYYKASASLDINYLSENFVSWKCPNWITDGYHDTDECNLDHAEDWCYDYEECYLQGDGLTNQCMQGYLGGGYLTSVTQCTKKPETNGDGRILETDEFDDGKGNPCNKCVAKTTCPLGRDDTNGIIRRSSIDCDGEIMGYVGDVSCKKCASPIPGGSQFSFTFDILYDDPDYLECRARGGMIQNCKQLFCQKRGKDFYPGTDFDYYVWDCNFNPGSNNCKCKRMGSKS